MILKTLKICYKYSPKAYFFESIFMTFEKFKNVFRGISASYVIIAIENKDIETIKFWAYISAGVISFGFIHSLIVNQFFVEWKRNLHLGLVNKYFKKFISLDNTTIENIGTGKLTNIIFQGIENIINLADNLTRTIANFICIIIMFVIMYIKIDNIYSFLVVCLVFTICFLLLFKGMKYIMLLRKYFKNIELDLDKIKVKILMSKFEILSNNSVSKDLDKIGLLTKKIKNLRKKSEFKKDCWQTPSFVLADGLNIVIYLVIGIGIINGKYDIATFALYVWIIKFIREYIWQIRMFFREYTANVIHIEKFFEFFDSTPQIRNIASGNPFIYKNGNIELKNISFSYGDSKVFEDFSLKLKGGKITAFVGESGGGKTTLMKLISGFIEANSGEIIIDGQKLSKLNLSSYYKEIGYLTQEPSVFDGTIFENLVYGAKKEPTEEQLKEVIKKAKCEFIFDFKDGINTEIGERGIRLSGGQKQRLAIAKIFLKDPKIILLDEPTSALDSKSEKLIHESFEELFKGKTVIIIAHRLQTVKSAEEIFVIEKGNVVETGTHKSLLKQKGNYYDMVELQSGF